MKIKNENENENEMKNEMKKNVKMQKRSHVQMMKCSKAGVMPKLKDMEANLNIMICILETITYILYWGLGW